MFLMIISSPLVRCISHKNKLYEFFSFQVPPWYIILYVGVRSEHSKFNKDMAELHFDSTPPFSLQQRLIETGSSSMFGLYYKIRPRD